MSIRRSQNIRSVRDIRTYSGRVDAGGVPYLGYLKIGCLEMEKARREKEREGALARVRNIDSRINDIEAEKSIILEKLSEHQGRKQGLPSKNDGTRHRNSGVPDGPSFRSGNGGNRDKDGFKIRY
jgi:hypothetical protein